MTDSPAEPSAPSHEVFDAKQGVETVYADGFYGVLISPQVTKVGLYVMVAVQEAGKVVVEQREIQARLVMPTVNLSEMCLIILGHMLEAGEKVGLANVREKLAELIDRK